MKKLNNFWIFKEELDEKELNFVTDWFGVSRENPRDLCKEQFDAWLEEDDAAFESLMQETMGGRLVFGHLFGYLKDFRRVLTTIKIFRQKSQEPNKLRLEDIESVETIFKSGLNLKRFWLEFFFNKIGVSVRDFVISTRSLDDSLIHSAARNSQIEALKYCLENGVDINKKSRGSHRLSGLTPLMCAVNCGATEAVDFLLRNGANPYIKDARGRTALDLVTTEEIMAILDAWVSDHPENTYPAE